MATEGCLQADNLTFVNGGTTFVSATATADTLTFAGAAAAPVNIKGVATPVAGNDAVNKDYVDNLIQGLSWINPARVATTANGTLATAFANGQTVDGVTLATGDRILLKDQTTATENGVYTVNATGAPTRVDEMATGDTVANYALFIQEGTVNGDQGFVQTNDTSGTGINSDIVDTGELTFVQFTGSGSIVDGFGLTFTGSTLDVDTSEIMTITDVDQTVLGIKTFANTDAVATDHTNTDVIIDDSLGVGGPAFFDGITSITNTTTSTDKDSGALVVEGGVGIEENLNVGGDLDVTGTFTSSGVFTITDATNSTDKDTGALIIENGGLGVEGNINAGGAIRAPTVCGTSDWRLKTDIKEVEEKTTNALLDLSVWRYKFKPGRSDNDHKERFGIMAQDAMRLGLDNIVFAGDNGILAVDYNALASLSLAVLQEQEYKLKTQDKQINELQLQMESLLV